MSSLSRLLFSRPTALTLVLVVGVLFTLVITGPRPAPRVNPPVQHLSEPAAVQVVAALARSPAAAHQIVAAGQAHRSDGMWFVTVNGAHFRFRETTRLVVPEDEPAAALLLGPSPSP
jgi:lysylphosphatidylglycerol synthetase-like protein (DUF2156 family)